MSSLLAERVDDAHHADTMASKMADRIRSFWCLNAAIGVLSTGVSSYACFQLAHAGLPLAVGAFQPRSRY